MRPDGAAAGVPGRVWYAAYASNMHAARFACYLRGGRPAGGARVYPGCRDAAPPGRAVPVVLPGRLYFALESPVWTGGLGLYDPCDGGEAFGRAYLVTVGQFSDIAAQEMRRLPDGDLDPARAVREGRDAVGPERYETLVCPGWLDGFPVLTVTAPWRCGDVPGNAPAAAYLRHLGAGLREAHGWTAERSAAYLAECPGARGVWSPGAIAQLLRESRLSPER